MRVLSEPMTWGEICERFPDQWLSLVELDWMDDGDRPYRLAFVAGHGSGRREARRHARPLGKVFAELGQFFTGKEPPGLPPIVYLTS